MSNQLSVAGRIHLAGLAADRLSRIADALDPDGTAPVPTSISYGDAESAVAELAIVTSSILGRLLDILGIPVEDVNPAVHELGLHLERGMRTQRLVTPEMEARVAEGRRRFERAVSQRRQAARSRYETEVAGAHDRLALAQDTAHEGVPAPPTVDELIAEFLTPDEQDRLADQAIASGQTPGAVIAKAAQERAAGKTVRVAPASQPIPGEGALPKPAGPRTRAT